MGHYQVTERFTSRDGVMRPDPREYGMTQHGLDVVGAEVNDLGGATQIFVRIDGGPSRNARFFTRNNALSFVREPKPESGWCVWDMTHANAGYNPEQGQVGWWGTEVDDAESEVADEIGLPHSWHVSTFVVFTWTEGDIDNGGDGDGGPDVPVPPDPTKTVFATLYTDGTWEQA